MIDRDLLGQHEQHKAQKQNDTKKMNMAQQSTGTKIPYLMTIDTDKKRKREGNDNALNKAEDGPKRQRLCIPLTVLSHDVLLLIASFIGPQTDRGLDFTCKTIHNILLSGAANILDSVEKDVKTFIGLRKNCTGKLGTTRNLWIFGLVNSMWKEEESGNHFGDIGKYVQKYTKTMFFEDNIGSQYEPTPVYRYLFEQLPAMLSENELGIYQANRIINEDTRHILSILHSVCQCTILAFEIGFEEDNENDPIHEQMTKKVRELRYSFVNYCYKTTATTEHVVEKESITKSFIRFVGTWLPVFDFLTKFCERLKQASVSRASFYQMVVALAKLEDFHTQGDISRLVIKMNSYIYNNIGAVHHMWRWKLSGDNTKAPRVTVVDRCATIYKMAVDMGDLCLWDLFPSACRFFVNETSYTAHGVCKPNEYWEAVKYIWFPWHSIECDFHWDYYSDQFKDAGSRIIYRCFDNIWGVACALEATGRSLPNVNSFDTITTIRAAKLPRLSHVSPYMKYSIFNEYHVMDSDKSIHFAGCITYSYELIMDMIKYGINLFVDTRVSSVHSNMPPLSNNTRIPRLNMERSDIKDVDIPLSSVWDKIYAAIIAMEAVKRRREETEYLSFAVEYNIDKYALASRELCNFSVYSRSGRIPLVDINRSNDIRTLPRISDKGNLMVNKIIRNALYQSPKNIGSESGTVEIMFPSRIGRILRHAPVEVIRYLKIDWGYRRFNFTDDILERPRISTLYELLCLLCPSIQESEITKVCDAHSTPQAAKESISLLNRYHLLHYAALNGRSADILDVMYRNLVKHSRSCTVKNISDLLEDTAVVLYLTQQKEQMAWLIKTMMLHEGASCENTQPHRRRRRRSKMLKFLIENPLK